MTAKAKTMKVDLWYKNCLVDLFERLIYLNLKMG